MIEFLLLLVYVIIFIFKIIFLYLILISGHNGGTGATPQTSVKYVGIPWEMGLTEANQVLTLNKLRHLVTLRTDGGIKTGRRR